MRMEQGSKKRGIVVLCTAVMLLGPPSFLFAQTVLSEEKELIWGGVEHGWHSLSSREHVRFDPGPMGQRSVVLEDDVASLQENTELLLRFDQNTQHLESATLEHYDLEKVEIFHSEQVKRRGAGGAGFLRYGNRLEIRPRGSSLFFAHDQLRSFSIDFYLYPTSVHDSIVVLSWYAPTVDEHGGPSGVRVYFRDGRLTWEFANIFHQIDGDPNAPEETPDASGVLVIDELHPTPVNEWHHHAMHYDALKSLITLTFDSMESNLIWVTHNRREQGNHLRGRISPYLGVPMVLGEHFLGYIDEFRISRGVPEDLTPQEMERYRAGSDTGTLHPSGTRYYEEGVIRSEVLDLKNPGTRILKWSWDSVEEQGTAVRLYFRVSNRYFTPDMEPGKAPQARDQGFPSDPEMRQREGRDMEAVFERLQGETAPPAWIPVRNDEEIGDSLHKGRYVQWKAELYGTEGRYTPRLNSLSLFYEPDPPPTPPILLAARPRNGSISLTWVKNKEHDVSSYRVYYGEASRFYVDNEPETVPQSPGETLTYELGNLVNNRVYFVSVTAVDDDGQESGFSTELIARPAAVYQ
jgi:hypothetical protein